ncbi:DUF4439 domain-containing protein [Humibacillus xanthopallidus]|uniref:Uncharacterized protein DUF4439 n=1 Tax=Humibacillus xanthopallidus TaxID=412689 RepID=A0A543HWJ6_9MICO|nr:DUF4439 domain-containing protein [Humibacillus xanthopallidus]TQM62672.1 uncharacterized protein DUF4439 [Humibacillus xanthopallidus]
MSGDTPRPGSREGVQPGLPGRRLLVLGGTAAMLTSVAGCGLRLDLPQPPPPVPTRKPAPDERFILAVIKDLRSLVRAAGTLEPRGAARGVVRETLAAQRRQITVLTGRLTNAGVPTAEITAATAPTPVTPPTSSGAAGSTGTPSATAGSPSAQTGSPTDVAAVRSVADLASVLATITPDRWAALAATTPGTRDLVLAAWSSRLASAVLLGATVDPTTIPSGARPRIIDQTSPLVYGFEVVAAQSTGARRTRALATLDALRRLDLAVAGSTTSTPGGWALPFPVTTPAEAQRLATHLLSTAVDATVDVAGATPDGPALDDTARWSGRVQALATDWGMPVAAFPGTSP